VVLRDGTALLGTVTSVTETAINLNAKGKSTTLSRSRVARIVFGQRKASSSTTKSSHSKK